MAIPTSWYCRTGGSNLNSGATDADAAVITRDAGTSGVVTGGTNLFDTNGGFNALAGTEGINIQVSGVSTIRGFSVVDDTNITLDASVANASYNYRIGGARVTINLVVGTGSGENAKIGSHDVYLEPGATFTETSIVFDTSVRFHMRGATIDGTGGGAGTDILSTGIAISPWIEGGVLANAVDRGFSSNQGGHFHRMLVQSAGGIGFAYAGGTVPTLSSARSCGSHGWGDQANSEATTIVACEGIDCTGAGFNLNRGGRLFGCLAADCGGGGAAIAHDVGANDWVEGCTFEGNTGPGLSLTGTLSGNHVAMNNVFTNNTTYGASAASDISGTDVVWDWNHYHGNGTAARNNVPTGDNDSSGDPLWADAATDDYTPGPSSPLLNAGYSPWKNSAAPTLGSVGASQDSFSGGGGGNRSTIFPSPWCSH